MSTTTSFPKLATPEMPSELPTYLIGLPNITFQPSKNTRSSTKVKEREELDPFFREVYDDDSPLEESARMELPSFGTRPLAAALRAPFSLASTRVLSAFRLSSKGGARVQAPSPVDPKSVELDMDGLAKTLLSARITRAAGHPVHLLLDGPIDDLQVAHASQKVSIAEPPVRPPPRRTVAPVIRWTDQVIADSGSAPADKIPEKDANASLGGENAGLATPPPSAQHSEGSPTMGFQNLARWHLAKEAAELNGHSLTQKRKRPSSQITSDDEQCPTLPSQSSKRTRLSL